MRTDDSLYAADFSSAVSTAGIVIRYSFYLIAALVLAMIGIGIIYFWNGRLVAISGPPAFRIAGGSFAQLPTSGHIVSSGRIGRVEVRQYGALHNRNRDLAVVMVMPIQGIDLGTEFGQDMREANLLRGIRAVSSATDYDLNTRFGEVRATEMRVNADGRWKQCLAFRTRFETSAVYFTGWLCDGSGSKPGAGDLACAIDQLVLDRELASKEADAFLRARMTKPANCSAQPVTQTTDMRSRSMMSRPSRWSQPTANTRW